MPAYEVVIKEVPAMTVASIRTVVPTYDDISPLYGEIFEYTERHRARPAGPGLAIYYDDEYRESDVDVEAAVPLSKDIPEGDRVKVRELAAVKEMASTVHKGNYDTMGQSYGRLLGWIEANGYRIVGPNREIYIECAGPEYEPAEYVTELQFPVQKV